MFFYIYALDTALWRYTQINILLVLLFAGNSSNKINW